MNNFDYKNMTPFKWFVLENFPFIENDFEAINNYRLFSKVVEYLNKTIDNVNVLGNLVEQFSDYFDNLDVQEEINQKLDEMATDGTLENIINQEIFTELNNQVSQNTSDISNLSTAVNENTSNINNLRNNINNEKITKLRKYYANNYSYASIPESFNNEFFNNFLPFTNDGKNYILKNEDVSYLKNTGSTKYYVSPNGNDENDGLTEATPKYSWQNTLSLISDGGTIVFAPRCIC